jgi:hypothetical protein
MKLNMPLSSGRCSDGTPVSVNNTIDEFCLQFMSGGQVLLVTDAANLSVVPANLCFEIALPDSYITGSNITLSVSSCYTSENHVDTQSYTPYVWKIGDTNGQFSSTSLCPAAAQTVTAVDNTTQTTITGASLHPGDRLFLRLQFMCIDTQEYDVVHTITGIWLTS